MIKRFEKTDVDFEAYKDAKEWLRAMGLSYGDSCGGLPVGIMRGEHSIAKWRNLTTRERAGLDGVIEFDDQDARRGGVTVTIYDSTTPTVKV